MPAPSRNIGVKLGRDVALDDERDWRGFVGKRASLVGREFVIALAESASGMMRKCKGQLNEFIVLLKICADIGDSEFAEWAVEQNEESFGDGCEEDEFAEVGEQAFDRLARAIGGKVLFPLLMPLAEQALSSQDWKMRRSGLGHRVDSGRLQESDSAQYCTIDPGDHGIFR